jgi:uncharacterized membrane protein YvlD (DUF360 family)
VHFVMAVVLLNSSMLAQGRDLIGLAAAILAAIMAANASWFLTDKVLARRAKEVSPED